jgi:hypothetical protein
VAPVIAATTSSRGVVRLSKLASEATDELKDLAGLHHSECGGGLGEDDDPGSPSSERAMATDCR